MKKEVMLAALSALLAGTLYGDKLSTEQIDGLLKELAQKPMPDKDKLSMGAMCYAPASSPERTEYVCPVCKTKTVHTGGLARRIAWDLPDDRNRIRQINELGLEATLDERSFCGKCSESMTPQPAEGELFIEITTGEKTTRTKLAANDLKKLTAFLSGGEVWKTDYDGEFPLLPELPRIRILLGISEEQNDGTDKADSPDGKEKQD